MSKIDQLEVDYGFLFGGLERDEMKTGCKRGRSVLTNSVCSLPNSLFARWF